MKMNPLELITTTSEQITPTLLNYEIGSDIESVLYHLIKKLKGEYEEFVIISFQDAYVSISKYLDSIYKDTSEVFKDSYLISINPFLEERLNPDFVTKTKDAEIIVGRISRNLGIKSNTLFLVLGLDLYGVKYPDELIAIIPAIVRVLSTGKNNNILFMFNVKIFSENIVEVMNSFALNVFKFGIEVKGNEIKRKLTVIRSPLVEYNLRSWYYTIAPSKIIFSPISGDLGL